MLEASVVSFRGAVGSRKDMHVASTMLRLHASKAWSASGIQSIFLRSFFFTFRRYTVNGAFSSAARGMQWQK